MEVATPSWKMKGLRSANDMVDSSAALVVAIVSDFVAASFVAVVEVVVLLVLRRMARGDRRPIC